MNFKITYKTHPKDVFTTDIRVENKIVGFIYHPLPDAETQVFSIRIAIATSTGHAMRTIKTKFESEKLARAWVKNSLYDLHKSDTIHFFNKD